MSINVCLVLEQDLTADDITMDCNVDEMFLNASSSEGPSMRRRNKPVKEHVRIEFKRLFSAFLELFDFGGFLVIGD